MLNLGGEYLTSLTSRYQSGNKPLLDGARETRLFEDFILKQKEVYDRYEEGLPKEIHIKQARKIPLADRVNRSDLGDAEQPVFL